MVFSRRFFLFGCAGFSFSSFAQAQVPLPAKQLIKAARTQIGITRIYDGAYQSLSYPNGDVPRARGVCTDVIIRAYRDAFDHDLQKLVHEDMRGNFTSYPALWGLTRPDRNIDHRRVPNLEAWLTRRGAKLPLPDDVRQLEAGDLVTMRLPGNLPHIALVSDKVSDRGVPYIIHNIGAGTREEVLSPRLQATLLHRFNTLAEAHPD